MKSVTQRRGGGGGGQMPWVALAEGRHSDGK